MEAAQGRGQVLGALGKSGEKACVTSKPHLRQWTLRVPSRSGDLMESWNGRALSNTDTQKQWGKKREGELTPLPEPWGSGPPGQGGTTHPLPLLSQDFGLCGVNRSWLFGGQGESRPPPAPLKGRQPLTTCCSGGCWWLQWGESWPLHEYWRLKFYIMILAGFVPIIEVKSCCKT